MNAAYPCLVADIGGTNARFAWVAEAGQAPAHVRVLPVRAHAGPESAVQAYLAEVGPLLGADYQAPRRAALALASVVDGDQVSLTNGPWRFARTEVQRALGLDALLLLNDFEALALSLPQLRPDQLRQWPGVAARSIDGGSLAVIGPGTGLGVAGMVHARHGWSPVASEGGHATLPAADQFEADLLAYVRREHEHVSAERLLSGRGLPLLHKALAAVLGKSAEVLTPEQITLRGLGGECAVSSQTLDVFCALLGGFAGNVALTFGAQGGVFIGGGIVPRLGERFFKSHFRQRFEAKGRFRSYLQAIPTPLITDTLVALNGAAVALCADLA